MAIQDVRAAVDALQFPKVSVRLGVNEYAGYLTETSAQMLLVELGQRGFVLVKRDDINRSDEPSEITVRRMRSEDWPERH